MHGSNLKRHTIKGLVWSFLDLMASQGIQFIIMMFLARLIMPEEFGLVAMILIFIALSNAIIEGGFNQALIREPHVTNQDYSTIFYFNLFVSIALYGVLFSSSELIAVFFEQPELKRIIRVYSIVIIINSLGIVQRVMLMKQMNFKVLAQINVFCGIVSGIAAIVLAWKGFGVWSIVFRTILMQSLQVILYWLSNRWKPNLTFSVSSFKKYFSFGSKMLASSILDTIYNNIYSLIIGKFFMASQLGYYTNAEKLRDIVSGSLTSSIQRVTFPAFSKLTSEKALKEGFRKVFTTTAYIHFPIMMGLAMVANPLIEIVYGDLWLPAVIYFQILCVDGMMYPLHSLYLNVLEVKGRSDLFLVLEIMKKIILTLLIVIVMVFKLGILGLIISAVIHSFICLILNGYYPSKQLSYSAKEQLKDIFPILIITITMAGFVYASEILISGSSFFTLISQICMGVAVYIGMSWILKIKEFRTIVDIIIPFVRNAVRS